MSEVFTRDGESDSTAEAGHLSVDGNIPGHVAVIMDGNGRWANQKGKPRSDGHRAGVENIRRIVRYFARSRIGFVTLFAFSTENWNRPAGEVEILTNLLAEAIDTQTHLLHKEGVRIKHIGRLDRLSAELQDAITNSVELTQYNDNITLTIAFNYGGRAEIIDAVRSIINVGLSPSEITEDIFGKHLYTEGLPDVDLIIRTAGEMRLSNFLLWQSHYAEYFCTDVFWPDFDENEISKALSAYRRRQRRYGKL